MFHITLKLSKILTDSSENSYKKKRKHIEKKVSKETNLKKNLHGTLKNFKH